LITKILWKQKKNSDNKEIEFAPISGSHHEFKYPDQNNPETKFLWILFMSDFIK
jgi:hypothetical protein